MQTHTHMVSDPYSCLALLLPCFLTHITKPNPTGVLCFSLSSPSPPLLSICLHDHSNPASPPQKGMLRNVFVPLQGNTSVNLPLSRPDPRHTSETPCMTWPCPPGQLQCSQGAFSTPQEPCQHQCPITAYSESPSRQLSIPSGS